MPAVFETSLTSNVSAPDLVPYEHCDNRSRHEDHDNRNPEKHKSDNQKDDASGNEDGTQCQQDQAKWPKPGDMDATRAVQVRSKPHRLTQLRP
jgi:hypothetical protein